MLVFQDAVDCKHVFEEIQCSEWIGSSKNISQWILLSCSKWKFQLPTFTDNFTELDPSLSFNELDFQSEMLSIGEKTNKSLPCILFL